MALSDIQVDSIVEFIELGTKSSYTPKYVANQVQIRVDDVAFVLKELHYDGQLIKRGTYYQHLEEVGDAKKL